MLFMLECARAGTGGVWCGAMGWVPKGVGGELVARGCLLVAGEPCRCEGIVQSPVAWSRGPVRMWVP